MSDMKEKATRFVREHVTGISKLYEEICVPDVRFHEYLPGLPEPLDRDGYAHFVYGF